jgi:hypothetical protein
MHCHALAMYCQQALGIEIEEIGPELVARWRRPTRIIEKNVAHEVIGDRGRTGAIGGGVQVVCHRKASLCVGSE